MLRRQVLNGSKMKIYYSRSKNVNDASINPLIGDFIQALPDHIRPNVELSKHDMGSSYDSSKLKNADLVIVGLNEETTSIGKGCYSELKEAFDLGIPVLCMKESLDYAQTINEDDIYLEDVNDWTNYAGLGIFDHEDDLSQDSILYVHLPSQKGQNKAAVFFVDDSKEVALYLKLIGLDEKENKPKGKLKLDNKEELLAYAKKYYPVGTKFKSAENGKTYTVKKSKNGESHYTTPGLDLSILAYIDTDACIGEFLYYNGRWAEIITEESKVEETMEKDLKQGDWVIGWHNNNKDAEHLHSKPWQVGKIDHNYNHSITYVFPAYGTISWNCDIKRLKKLTREEVLEWVRKEYPLNCEYQPLNMEGHPYDYFSKIEGTFVMDNIGYYSIGAVNKTSCIYSKGNWASKKVTIEEKQLVCGKWYEHKITKNLFIKPIALNGKYIKSEVIWAHGAYTPENTSVDIPKDWVLIEDLSVIQKFLPSGHPDLKIKKCSSIIEMNKIPKWNKPTSSYQTGVSDNDILLLLK